MVQIELKVEFMGNKKPNERVMCENDESITIEVPHKVGSVREG
jgi:hypothetical protein